MRVTLEGVVSQLSEGNYIAILQDVDGFRLIVNSKDDIDDEICEYFRAVLPEADLFISMSGDHLEIEVELNDTEALLRLIRLGEIINQLKGLTNEDKGACSCKGGRGSPMGHCRN